MLHLPVKKTEQSNYFMQEFEAFMNIRTICLFTTIAALAGCGSPGENDRHWILSDQYSNIDNIIATADCHGPEGSYRTHMEYTVDGYTYFKQEFDYKDDQLNAVVFGDSIGYVINDDQYIQGALSPASIEIINGHEFQLMATRPQEYFVLPDFQTDTVISGEKLERYMAYDHRELPVYIDYDRRKKRIARISLPNTQRQEHRIDILFDQWESTAHGLLPQLVRILQTDGTEYVFNYHRLTINAPDFRRIVPQQTEVD